MFESVYQFTKAKLDWILCPRSSAGYSMSVRVHGGSLTRKKTHTRTHTQSKPLLSFHLSQETIPAALKASLCVSVQALSNTVTQETSGADKRHDHNAWTWWLWSLSSTSIPQRGKERRERTDEGMSMKGRTEGVVSTWGFSLLSPSSCLLCLCLCGFLYII